MNKITLSKKATNKQTKNKTKTKQKTNQPNKQTNDYVSCVIRSTSYINLKQLVKKNRGRFLWNTSPKPYWWETSLYITTNITGETKQKQQQRQQHARKQRNKKQLTTAAIFVLFCSFFFLFLFFFVCFFGWDVVFCLLLWHFHFNHSIPNLTWKSLLADVMILFVFCLKTITKCLQILVLNHIILHIKLFDSCSPPPCLLLLLCCFCLMNQPFLFFRGWNIIFSQFSFCSH